MLSKEHKKEVICKSVERAHLVVATEPYWRLASDSLQDERRRTTAAAE